MQIKITRISISGYIEAEDPKPPDSDNVWELVSTACNGMYLFLTWKLIWTKEEKETVHSIVNVLSMK